ncbi:MAG TPA: hypothetical protein VFS22_03270 [Flavisolibacter sp.]|nr:hypothetical protein [Flavisolibacter sp.]
MIPQQVDPILQQVNNNLSLTKREEIRQQLASCINYLLVHDFARLVQTLYRADVNEQKLKQLLQEQPQTDAAVLIADLLIQRQEEKIKTRDSFPSNNDIPEEERW